MNETDFIRQQLTLERTHLREVLQSICHGSPCDTPAHPAALYIDWAGRRLVHQVLAHQTALQATALDAALRAQLAVAANAAARAQTGPASPAHARAERLLVLLEAWSEALDAAAGRALRVAHWRRTAHLSADTILEERQRYAAARGTGGP